MKALLDTPASISAQTLHLDGLVLYAFLKETGQYQESLDRGSPFPDLPNSWPVFVFEGVPMCTDFIHESKVFRGSFTKRTSLSDLDYLQKKFHSSGGPRKDKKKTLLLHCDSEFS